MTGITAKITTNSNIASSFYSVVGAEDDSKPYYLSSEMRQVCSSGRGLLFCLDLLLGREGHLIARASKSFTDLTPEEAIDKAELFHNYFTGIIRKVYEEANGNPVIAENFFDA